MQTRRFEGRDGVWLAADVGGDPAHPSVILLHGGGQTRHSWKTATWALVARGNYVVSLDLRGHGESDWSKNGDYGFDSYVADLFAVIRLLRTKPTLIGASLGGLVSLLAVGENGGNFARALVLVDVTPKLNRQGTERIVAFMQSHPNGFASLEEAADAVARFLPHRPRPGNASGLYRNLRMGPDGRYYWRWDPGFHRSYAAMAPEAILKRCESAARKVTIPTLLVRGSLSEVVDEEGIRHFLSVIPSAQFVDVRGASHMVAGDKNDAFNAAVIGFLAQIPDQEEH